jgi:hypothetical protein
MKNIVTYSSENLIRYLRHLRRVNTIDGDDGFYLHFDIWSVAWRQHVPIECGEFCVRSLQDAKCDDAKACCASNHRAGAQQSARAARSAHSAAHLGGKPLSHELEDLIAYATELRQRIVHANGVVAAATAD